MNVFFFVVYIFSVYVTTSVVLCVYGRAAMPAVK